jgi:hypothetical protein
MPLNQQNTLRSTEVKSQEDVEAENRCGPKPTKPNYLSTQEERDKWITWNLCKDGA